MRRIELGLLDDGVGTMPRAFDVVKENGKYVYKPNILLTGEPELKTSPKQTSPTTSTEGRLE